MSDQPTIVLHGLPPSHPSRAAEAAIRFKGLEFERGELDMNPSHSDHMESIYGEGNRTVPGIVVDGEPVHGSRAIFARLDEIVPEPSLHPEPIAEAVREADRWGDEELQDLGRSLPWGALHFRPESMGTFAGGEILDPAGTDFAIRFVRGMWKYHGISAERLAEHLSGLPAKVRRIEEFAAEGIIGGEEPTAADLQIGSTIRVLLTIGDLEPLLAGTAGERIALRWFSDYPGHVPPGAFPRGWVPAA
jgi:glutathione S-transferase